ncbi:unnamed protein product, partial [Ixodes pacificus]
GEAASPASARGALPERLGRRHADTTPGSVAAAACGRDREGPRGGERDVLLLPQAGVPHGAAERRGALLSPELLPLRLLPGQPAPGKLCLRPHHPL